MLASIAMIIAGLGEFGFGVARHVTYQPILLVALAIMGLGMGAR